MADCRDYCVFGGTGGKRAGKGCRYLDRRRRAHGVPGRVVVWFAAGGPEGILMGTTAFKRGRTIVGGVAVLVAATALLTGCGSEADGAAAPASPVSSAPAGNGVAALEPSAIVAKAKAALQDATSFRVKGDDAEGGKTMKLDLKVKAGGDFTGSITKGKSTLELLAVDGKRYMRPDEAFFVETGTDAKQAKAIATVMGERWMLVPSNEKDLADLFSLGDVDVLVKPEGKLSKGEARKIDGVPAIGVVETSDDAAVLFVATEGEPYPLAVEALDSGKRTMTFSDFGTSFPEIKPLAAKDVLDLSQLK
jgi:hypothetical protein